MGDVEATESYRIDLFHNDVKRGFQDDTQNLIGSA